VPRSYLFLASIIREENLLTRHPVMVQSDFRELVKVAFLSDVLLLLCCLLLLLLLLLFLLLY
jgi:hypothetical protein